MDVMLEKIHGVSRSDKLRIILLLEADLNQVLRITVSTNIMKLAKNQSAFISDHQYGWANQTCITPILNKLMMVQLILDRDIIAVMLRSAEKCSIRKQHDTHRAPYLSKATHTIMYWTTRISKNGI
jgi:hypothetical protein